MKMTQRPSHCSVNALTKMICVQQNRTKRSVVNRCGAATPALRSRDFTVKRTVASSWAQKPKCGYFQEL